METKTKNRLKDFIKYCLVILTAFFLILVLEIKLTKVPNQIFLIENMPPKIRNLYLNNLFDKEGKDCWDCYIRMTAALDILHEDLYKRKNSYNFNYAKLLPLLRETSENENIREPIPAQTCNILLLSKDKAIYKQMFEKYKNDRETLESCTKWGLMRVEEIWPSDYLTIKPLLDQSMNQ